MYDRIKKIKNRTIIRKNNCF